MVTAFLLNQVLIKIAKEKKDNNLRSAPLPLEGAEGVVFSRHRIIPMPSPGMTSANPFKREPEPFYGTILFKCFNTVLGAGWCKAALRPQQRRYDPLV